MCLVLVMSVLCRLCVKAFLFLISHLIQNKYHFRIVTSICFSNSTKDSIQAHVVISVASHGDLVLFHSELFFVSHWERNTHVHTESDLTDKSYSSSAVFL